jgi:putative endonuclease
MKEYYVYILQCSDKSYYTGITNDVERRFAEHQSGFIKGYTSNKLPVSLVFSARFSDVNEAIRFEKQVKGWSIKKKEALFNSDIDLLIELSNSKRGHPSSSSG